MVNVSKIRIIWFFIVLVLAVFIGSFFFINQNNEVADELEEIDLGETIGFYAEGLPVTAASGVFDYYDEEGALHYDVYLQAPGESSELESIGIHFICDPAISVKIGDVSYHSGDIIYPPSFMEDINGNISTSTGRNEDVVFRFINTSGIASVNLGTYDQPLDYLKEVKGNTASGFCTVIDDEGLQDYTGNCSIRIHGNTSWYDDKRSFQFNLENPQEILGMSEQEKYILISEYCDTSLMKDAVFYALSRRMGDEYAPEFRFVNVFFNGEYEGVYILVQKIAVDGGSLHITDLEPVNELLDEDNASVDISGGYLVELTGKLSYEEHEEFLRIETPRRWMFVRAPGNITERQRDYLSGIINTAEEALYLPDGEYTEDGFTWEDYFEKESWVRQYLLQEISLNLDADIGSEYFYIDKGDIFLTGGPGWDFNRAFDNFTANESKSLLVRSLHNNAIHDYAKESVGIQWLKALDMHESFHNSMKEYFFDNAEPNMEQIIDEDFPSWEAKIDIAVRADRIRWESDYDAYQDAVAALKSNLEDRISFLHDYYLNEDDYVYLNFRISDLRYDFIIPIIPGNSLGDMTLPLVNDSMDWYCDGVPFTNETIVYEDMELIQTQKAEG